mmetsp:Transcript_31003/g.78567  ORF Transcript_31003/g.78567 Transcript_31003/m.78567 type:complete len:218 (+) Transcript_31003:756-1409(+)
MSDSTPTVDSSCCAMRTSRAEMTAPLRSHAQTLRSPSNLSPASPSGTTFATPCARSSLSASRLWIEMRCRTEPSGRTAAARISSYLATIRATAPTTRFSSHSKTWTAASATEKCLAECAHTTPPSARFASSTTRTRPPTFSTRPAAASSRSQREKNRIGSATPTTDGSSCGQMRTSLGAAIPEAEQRPKVRRRRSAMKRPWPKHPTRSRRRAACSAS